MSTENNFDSVEAIPEEDAKGGHRRMNGAHADHTETHEVKSSIDKYHAKQPVTVLDYLEIIEAATAKSRDEKIRMAKDEYERKRKLKMAALEEAERHSRECQDRVLAEKRRRIEEMHKRSEEKRRSVEERRKKMEEAEKERRALLLRKVQEPHNLSNANSPGTSGNWSFPGPALSTSMHRSREKPRSTTGRIFGFGSSTPRNICEPTPRPASVASQVTNHLPAAGMSMSLHVTTSHHSALSNQQASPTSPQHHSEPRKRVGAFSPGARRLDKMAVSETDVTTTSSSVPKSTPRPSRLVKDSSGPPPASKRPPAPSPSHAPPTSSMVRSTEMRSTPYSRPSRTSTPKPRVKTPALTHTNDSTPSGSPLVSPRSAKSSSSERNAAVKLLKDESTERTTNNTSVKTSRPIHSVMSTSLTRKKKEEHVRIEAPKVQTTKKEIANGAPRSSPKHKPSHLNIQQPTLPIPTSNSGLSPSGDGPIGGCEPGEAALVSPGGQKSSKEVTEAEYRAKLAEQRRLAREKIEQERELQRKAEEEKRCQEEEAARQRAEEESCLRRELEEEHMREEQRQKEEEEERKRKEEREKEETERLQREQEEQKAREEAERVEKERIERKQREEEERQARKKKLEMIMSRVKKGGEEGGDGEKSPGRALSPSPPAASPVDPEKTKFKSSILQTMLASGRLSSMGKAAAVLRRGLESSSANSSTTSLSTQELANEARGIPVSSSAVELSVPTQFPRPHSAGAGSTEGSTGADLTSVTTTGENEEGSFSEVHQESRELSSGHLDVTDANATDMTTSGDMSYNSSFKADEATADSALSDAEDDMSKMEGDYDSDLEHDDTAFGAKETEVVDPSSIVFEGDDEEIDNPALMDSNIRTQIAEARSVIINEVQVELPRNHHSNEDDDCSDQDTSTNQDEDALSPHQSVDDLSTEENERKDSTARWLAEQCSNDTPVITGLLS